MTSQCQWHAATQWDAGCTRRVQGAFSTNWWIQWPSAKMWNEWMAKWLWRFFNFHVFLARTEATRVNFNPREMFRRAKTAKLLSSGNVVGLKTATLAWYLRITVCKISINLGAPDLQKNKKSFNSFYPAAKYRGTALRLPPGASHGSDASSCAAPLRGPPDHRLEAQRRAQNFFIWLWLSTS